MIARQWYNKAMKRWGGFKQDEILEKLNLANSGAKEDYLNINGCLYYQGSACLIDVMKPKQVIELGGAMGVWTICASHFLPETSDLYSITLPEGGLDFAYISNPAKNVHLIRGNDLDIQNWEGVNLRKTDLWFFDTGIADEHTEKQLRQELQLYEPYFRKGTVILFDDIHKNSEMESVWRDIDWDKLNITDPWHYSGFGLTVYDKKNN